MTIIAHASARLALASLLGLSLSFVSVAAAPFTTGGILVTQLFQTNVLEFSPQGVLLQTIPVPHPEFVSDPRGLTLDIMGRLQVYNHPFQTYLSTYDPASNTWVHHNCPGWSSYNCFPCDAVGAYMGYVFATDEAAFPTQQNGIVRFNTTDYSCIRFASGQDYSDLSVGLDGLVYAERANAPPAILDVFDPVSMSKLRTVTLDVSSLTIAVNQQGHIFGPQAQGINEFDANGHLLASHPMGVTGYLYDIDISPDGRLLATTDGGLVVLTDLSYNPVATFRAGFSFCYATFGPTGVTPVRTASWGRVKQIYR
jgi:hypothetical protein